MKTTQCPIEIWQEMCYSDKTATFFQTPAWHQLYCNNYAAETFPLLFDWGPQKAVLPLVRSKKSLFFHYFSPFGTYTSILADTQLTISQKQAIESKLRHLDIDLFSSPFGNNQVHTQQKQAIHTYVVPLNNLSSEKLEKSWRKGHRDNWRMALKKGVTVFQSNSDGYLDGYWNLYQQNLQRWGKNARSHYTYSFFKNLWKNLCHSDACKCWFAQVNGKIIYAVIVFYHNRHVVAWHSASSSEDKKYYPSQAIYHAIISDAINNHFDYFDFNPSVGMSGVIRFKQGFGAEPRRFFRSKNEIFWLKMARRLKKIYAGQPHA